MSRLRRNVVANFIGQAWIAAMGLVFIPVYIRYLGMEAYGLIGIFAVLLAVFNLLDLGMTSTLKREMARFTAGGRTGQSIHDLLRSIEWLCAVLVALAVAVVWIGSDALAANWLQVERLPLQEVSRAIWIMAAVVALRFVEGIYKGAILGLQDQVHYNLVAAAVATVRNAGVVLVLAYVSPTVTAFFVWQGLVSLASLAIYAASTHRLLPRPERRPRFDMATLRNVGGYAGGTLAITALALMLTQMDKILLMKLLPLQAFGYYALATALSAKLTSVISPITQALFPRMVELVTAGDEGSLVARFHQAAQLVTVLTAPLALGLAFFAEGVLLMWTGDPPLAHATAPLLALLAGVVFLNGLMWVPYQCALAHGWTSLGVKANLVAVVLLVPAVWWSTQRYGATGAATARLLLNLGYLLASAHFLHARILRGQQWRWYAHDLLLPTLGAATVMAGLSLLRPDAWLGRWGWLPFLLAACALAAAAAAALAPDIRARALQVLAGPDGAPSQ